MKRLAFISFLGLGAMLGLSSMRESGPSRAQPVGETASLARPAASRKDANQGWKAPATRTNGSVNAEALAGDLLARGGAALADGDMRAGFDSYRRAVEYFPSAETHGSLGELYLKSAVTGEAAFHLRRAAELDPYDADRWLMLANAYFLKQDLGAAWKAVNQAKTVEPGIVLERDSNNFMTRASAG